MSTQDDPRCRIWLGNFGLWYWICYRCMRNERVPAGGIRPSQPGALGAALMHARLVHR